MAWNILSSRSAVQHPGGAPCAATTDGAMSPSRATSSPKIGRIPNFLSLRQADHRTANKLNGAEWGGQEYGGSRQRTRTAGDHATKEAGLEPTASLTLPLTRGFRSSKGSE